MTTPALSTVTPRGVLKASRALFVLIGLLLAPLMAQYLFGPFARAEAWALALVAAPIPSLLLARQVTRESSGEVVAVLRMLGLGALFGALTGVVSGLAWVSLMSEWMSDRHSVGALFGAIYGAVTGLGLGAVFALWTWRARKALARPSVLSAQQLTIDAGVLLTAAATYASWRYEADGVRAASVVTGVVGAFVVIAAIVRVLRLQKLYDAVQSPHSALQIAQRAPSTSTPALVWSSFHDHVIVQGGDPTSVDPAPFRENAPVVEVAAVPRDPAAVRHALGRTLAYGFVALGIVGFLETSVMFQSCVRGCPSSQQQPCGGCEH